MVKYDTYSCKMTELISNSRNPCRKIKIQMWRKGEKLMKTWGTSTGWLSSPGVISTAAGSFVNLTYCWDGSPILSYYYLKSHPKNHMNRPSFIFLISSYQFDPAWNYKLKLHPSRYLAAKLGLYSFELG